MNVDVTLTETKCNYGWAWLVIKAGPFVADVEFWWNQDFDCECWTLACPSMGIWPAVHLDVEAVVNEETKRQAVNLAVDMMLAHLDAMSKKLNTIKEG